MPRFIPFWGIIAFVFLQATQAPALAADAPNSWQVFYLDFDQDSYGDPNVPAVFTDETPPNRLWVTTGDDPKDTDPFTYPLVVPKGTRLLGLDFAEGASDGRFRPDLARELGAEVTTLNVLWSEVETSPGFFQGPQVEALNSANNLYSREGFALSLAIDPLTGPHPTLPPDLRQGIAQGNLRWSSTAVRDRLRRLLDFAHARLAGTHLVSLQIGYEVDRYFQQVPTAQFWADYLAMFRDAAAYARTLWGTSLKVAVTFSQAGLEQVRQTPALRALLDASDFLSLTYVTGPDALPPGGYGKIANDLAAAVALAGTKPVAFQSVGFPSAPLVGSSETQQSQFVKAFFTAWDHHADRIFLICFTRLYDASPAYVQGFDTAIQPYIQSLGLRRYDQGGTAKPAYHTLRNEAFERGWWRIAPATSRRYRLGFTPMPYDSPPDAAGQLTVSTYIDDKIRTEADLIAVHLDGGIPWREALADPWTSPEPPYSPSLLDSWRHYQAHIPQGHKLLVSITPMGIPRNLLAAYWGYGEGFEYTEDFRRIGNGAFADAENRLPPPPFDHYDFDHPDVKRAFLSYAIRTLEYFHPDYLCIGIEVSAALVRDATAYAKFLDLHRFVYQTLKADSRYAQIPILVSISATSFMTDEYGPLISDRSLENSVAYKYDEMEAGMRERLIQGLREILPYTDVLGLSLYLHYGKYNAYRIPASVYDSLFAILKEAGLGNKPIAVTESGYTGDAYTLLETNLFAGSPEKQARHLKLLFYELGKQPNPVSFIVNFQVRDTDRAWQRAADSGFNPLFSEFHKYFRDIGLYDGDGLARPSAALWRKELSLPYKP